MAISNGNESGRSRQVGAGDFVAWEGVVYRVARRRGVSALAMFQTCDFEVYLTALDGRGGPGWVGANEVESVNLPDGWYFTRPTKPVALNTRREWRVVRCVGGSVQVLGVPGRFGPHCEHVRECILVRIEPPRTTDAAAGLRLVGGNDDGTDEGDGGEERVRTAAEGIVDTLLGAFPAAVAFYRGHPELRGDLVDQIVRVIEASRD